MSREPHARLLEVELLLQLIREAHRVLSECEVDGLPLSEAADRFLTVLPPQAGAVGGVARFTPTRGSPTTRFAGLTSDQARAVLHAGGPGLEGSITSRHRLRVRDLELGELYLVYPDTLRAQAAERTEVVAEALAGAVLTLSGAANERELAAQVKALERANTSDDAVFGRYTLIKLLGTGGMAQVHLARVDGPGGVARVTALKRMLPHLTRDSHLTAMFLDEARVASLIAHPHVARVEDFGELGGTYFLAMEFLAGVDTATLVDSTIDRGGIPVSYAVSLASQVAMGLHAAHELADLDGRPLNLVHRDVSPQNVMVTFDGVAKLVDFGVAKSQVQREQTRDLAVKGKLCYMSPEQCQGRPIDRRADIFALGAVLYELLLGRPLFLRQNDGATLRALLDEPIPSLVPLRDEVNDELWRVIRRALTRNPDERYSTAFHFSCALDGWLKAGTGTPSGSEIGRWLRQSFPGRAEEIAGWASTVHRIPTRILPGTAL